MKKIHANEILDGFQAIKTHINNIKTLVGIFLRPARMKCAALGPFSVMNFDLSNDQSAGDYLTVAQLSNRFPAFSQGSIRWLIFNANTNGFNKVVRKIGRKVVLNLHDFKKFVEEQALK